MFGKKKDPKEIVKEQKRITRRGQRDLDKDHRDLEKQEKQLVSEIKKYAQQNNKSAATTLAKQLVRVRNQMAKNTGMKARMSAVNNQTTLMASNVQMAESMKGATKAMGSMNKSIDIGQMQKTMQQFEQESMKMEMSEEMMNDTLDTLDEDTTEEETQIMASVLDEIGIQMNQEMGSVPSGRVGTKTKLAAAENDDDFEARMNSLLGS